MTKSSRKCLYCQSENNPSKNKANNDLCNNCGMTLPKKHPKDKHSKLSFFIKAFWIIVMFCVFMVLYLPR